MQLRNFYLTDAFRRPARLLRLLDVLELVGDSRFSQEKISHRINFARSLLSETKKITAQKILRKKEIESAHFSEINANVRRVRINKIEQMKNQVVGLG